VVLNSSRALDRAGLNFLSTYPDGLGSVLLRFDKMHAGAEEQNFDRPAVIGILAPRFYPGLPAREQEVKARAELLETPFRSYESRIREDLARVLGPWGFDAAREIAAITLHRWAHHGYVFGYPGFFSGEAVRIASRLHGRIAFAHTDLHRFSVVLGAIEQGYRAAQELADKTWKYGSALGQAQMPAAS
jgi:spermidine dehydrogenase